MQSISATQLLIIAHQKFFSTFISSNTKIFQKIYKISEKMMSRDKIKTHFFFTVHIYASKHTFTKNGWNFLLDKGFFFIV